MVYLILGSLDTNWSATALITVNVLSWRIDRHGHDLHPQNKTFLLTLNGGVDVEVEAVFALVAKVGNQSLEVLESALGHPFQSGSLVGDVRQLLRTHGAHGVGDSYSVPGRRRPRRTEAV